MLTAQLKPSATPIIEALAVVVLGSAIKVALRAFGADIVVGSLSIVVPLAVATWLLWRRGASWRELGLRRPPELGTALGWALGLFLFDMLIIPPLASQLGNALGWPRLQLAAFADLRGNVARYLVMVIPIAWGSAAIGEELLFRGFLAGRLQEGFGSTRAAEFAANLGQAALFALGHIYLGPRGMLNAGALGFVAGLAYRWGGRNLWPLIIAHGLVDSAGITALYLGVAGHS